jgi:gentisate 1,2-dioxygenase
MVTTRFTADDDGDLDALYQDVAEADLQPLWLLKGLLPEQPNSMRPHVWRAKTLRHLAERAGDLVGIDRGGDRRVLGLAHPDLGGLPFATRTLWGAVQYLGPGELAPAHRHSPSAVRFVLEGSGVFTLVNGDPVRMEPGDLVLTPSYAWHEHHNPGDEPMIWFDGLDLPLIGNLDAVFFENGSDELTAYDEVPVSRSEQLHGTAGLRPLHTDPSLAQQPGEHRHSPLMTYRWVDTDRALDTMLAATGARAAAMRYVDPLTGRDMMPTLRGEMHRLLPGHRTPTTRTVGSGIWVVHRGTGASVVNGVRYEWGAGDILVTPSWAAVDHEATERADLFLLSDGPVIEAVGLARTETLPHRQTVTDTVSA